LLLSLNLDESLRKDSIFPDREGLILFFSGMLRHSVKKADRLIKRMPERMP
jgi:hypothetical protein